MRDDTSAKVINLTLSAHLSHFRKLLRQLPGDPLQEPEVGAMRK